MQKLNNTNTYSKKTHIKNIKLKLFKILKNVEYFAKKITEETL